MYRDVFARLDSIALPIVAMGFFLLAFVLVLLRTFLQKGDEDYDEIAALPLEDRDSSDRSEVTP